MIVNGVNIINKYGLVLLEKKIQANKIISYVEWLENSKTPLKLKPEKAEFSSIFVKLLVEGENEGTVLLKISNIINDCKSGIVKFDDINFAYKFTIENHNSERIVDEAYNLTLTLKSDYKIIDQAIETINRVTSKTINVVGNQETPCIIEITPSISLVDLIITGLEDGPITIKNLTAGKKVIINGEDGTVLENGINKFGDTDLWEWPRLKAGSNSITVSKNSCDITIKYKPRYI